MVGIVLVSHSKKLAEGVKEFAEQMAPHAKVAAAGGLDDGTFGTSFERIKHGIESVNEGDGVLVIMDLGSAVMTTEMVIESLEEVRAEMVDCPFIEGAVAAIVVAACGEDLENVKKAAENSKNTKKF